ncbi:transcriptional regulator, MarR family [Novosphingobium nitrogenifigens DSM 19370]|uniref:Transcriptional regulator, MarR family n=1 Tax=Novosphingobium nitrogenifigens DSM 19370 TaxID=983920 RepID=F1ZB71_9SPHN|nr:MarR family transcriptional regulator [Novosphingobium nitrogenifigens]EGD58062.1 transcriptional regulator, MarR family [Novosphingobium nitrogenifigens DSM 19370]
MSTIIHGEEEERAALYALTNAIQPARRAWQQVAAAALSQSGLSVAVAMPVLFVSRLGDGVLQARLAEEIGVHPAALARALVSAEKDGLIERRAVPGDRRARGVCLTERGRDLAARMEEELALRRRIVLGDMPIGDVVTAVRVLRRLEEQVRAGFGRHDD